MKKMKFYAVLLAAVCIMSSCYSSRVLSGNVKETDPVVEVNKNKNQFLFWGLLPLKNVQQANEFVGGKTNYVSQTSWTFTDGLLNCITLGIYTPTTTTYFLPVKEANF